jgi:hypothetical protein
MQFGHGGLWLKSIPDFTILFGHARKLSSLVIRMLKSILQHAVGSYTGRAYENPYTWGISYISTLIGVRRKLCSLVVSMLKGIS